MPTSTMKVANVSTVDEGGAETWRCQLLRILCLRTKQMRAGDGGSTRASLIARYSIRRFAAPHQACKELDIPEEMVTSFASIVKEAINLAWSVWTHKIRVECAGPTQLIKDYGEVGKILSASSSLFELHSMHGRDVDEDPHALDGEEIVLLCGPVIRTAGDADGEIDDKNRIIHKPVVWL